MVKLQWDFNVRCKNVIRASGHGWVIDIAISGDIHVVEKENDKVDRYQDLKHELACFGELESVELYML